MNQLFASGGQSVGDFIITENSWNASVGKEEVNVYLFTDKMIVYVGRSMGYTKELLQLINEFSMVSGYKDTLESALDCKIKPVNPKGNQSWIFIGRTDAEAEA